jgi:bifunctional diaminopimelate decarboxylase / aspartate kinase
MRGGPVSEPQPWVVLKFGGTSVSSRARWETVARRIRQVLEAGERPLVVCSAVSQVSNQLERAVAEAARGAHEETLAALVERHRAHARDLGVDFEATVGDLAEDLERLLLGISLLQEASPRQHARVLSAGELLSTRLGAAFLEQAGLDVHWLDARSVLRSRPADGRPAARYLSAAVDDHADPALEARLRDGPPVVLTQGFIARDADGATVLLGRGGSDTSAALFAARVKAARCEIWTDVPGLFTADPRRIPGARLLRRLGYDEAQELASMGAKVLHPRCLGPVARHGIPLHVRCTPHPDWPGTVVERVGDGGDGPRVHAISAKRGVTLVRMDAQDMWQQVGFLADVFAAFKARGLSVDLVSTSETNVTVSLDASETAHDPAVLEGLLRDLAPLCHARTIGPCSAVSLVGRRIRGLLHRLGPALEAFEEHRIHLVTQAASDLNLTVVVDEAQADRLVGTLHALLFEGADPDGLGPTWRALRDEGAPGTDAAPTRRRRWWEDHRQALLDLAADGPRYVLHGPTIDAAADGLLGLEAVDRVLYAMKANPHPDVLRRLAGRGVGIETVSVGEIEAAFAAVPDLDPDRVLFTPNFAHRDELAHAVQRGVRIGLDALHPLRHWGEVLDGVDLQLRIDPGTGRGHHDHVRTAGARSKFGIRIADLPEAVDRARQVGARIVGLHAHAGSGIRTPGHWAEVATLLARLAADLPDVRHLDLGGGLGVPEKPGEAPLDLAALDAALAEIRQAHPDLDLWIEPGRYLVAPAGVLLARVTQLKEKDGVRYVGVETGMNSLLRPALYGAWHDIVNLSRWGAPADWTGTVVGPICESADTLGRDRLLPETREGDVLLVDVTGAYGSAMGSRYNLREVAPELVLDS